MRAVQQWLAALGYQPGRTDGRPGEETVKAIRDFEMDKGLVPARPRIGRTGGAPQRSGRVQARDAGDVDSAAYALETAAAGCAQLHRPYSRTPCG